MRNALATICALLCATACGSADRDELPPPEPGAKVVELRVEATGVAARLDPRARTLTVGDETETAGIGPYDLATEADRLYVTDARGDALLVYVTRPKLELIRRVEVKGRPTRMSKRGDELRITLEDEGRTALYTGNGRPNEVDEDGNRVRPD